MPTPRPWKVAHYTGESHIIAHDLTNPDRIHHIAVVIEQRDALDTLANARLLAAAPDLLTACQDALRLTEGLANPSLRPNEAHTIRTLLQRTLTPAIRRALR